MIIAFKDEWLYNSYSKNTDKLFHQVTDSLVPLHKELNYPTTTLDKVKGKYVYYDNVRKFAYLPKTKIQNNDFKLLPDKVKQDINNDKCFYIINDSEPDVDGGNWINDYPKFLKDAGINPSKCNILTAKTTYKNNQIQYFKNTYYWTLFERLVQNNHQKEIKKTLTNPKKFLCVNRSPIRHKSLFMAKVMPMLDDFNASIDDAIQKVVYDIDRMDKKDNKVKYMDLSHWSRENCIYIITETNCHDIDGTDNAICLTEKTYKAMELKLPFIIVGSQYCLKMLQHQGYKTFNNLWDESYDDIPKQEDRINAVVKLVKDLRTKDLEKLVMDNLDILEHNYNNFISRKSKLELTNLKKDIEDWFK